MTDCSAQRLNAEVARLESIDLSPEGLEKLRLIIKREERREGWKTATFGFFTDTSLIAALIDALEAERKRARRRARKAEKGAAA